PCRSRHSVTTPRSTPSLPASARRLRPASYDTATCVASSAVKRRFRRCRTRRSWVAPAQADIMRGLSDSVSGSDGRASTFALLGPRTVSGQSAAETTACREWMWRYPADFGCRTPLSRCMRRDRDNELGAQGGGDSFEHRDGWNDAAGLESGQRRLGHASAGG